MGVHYSVATNRLCIQLVTLATGATSVWRDDCSIDRQEITMPRFWNAALLCAALAAPIAITPTTLRADDQRTDQKNARTYHDRNHNDDHEWNSHEDQAYRMYLKENHRKYREFSRLKENDQQSYWDWRHEHSDALLKIEIK